MSQKIPGLSKYVLYAAPGLTIATLAIWTINDKNVRRFIETRISSHFGTIHHPINMHYYISMQRPGCGT